MTQLPLRRRRVLLWDYHIERGLVDALAELGFDVVFTVDDRLDGVPGLHWSELHCTPQPAPSGYQPALVPSMRASTRSRYQRCVARLAQVPFTRSWYLQAGGALEAGEIEDWARWHMAQCAIVLQRHAIDEVWFTTVPHFGLDIAMAEVAELSGLTVLRTRQLQFPAKFLYEVRSGARKAIPRLAATHAWTDGAIDFNLFYMQPRVSRPARVAWSERFRALLAAIRTWRWRALGARVWRGAVDRRWWHLVLALESLDPVTRAPAAKRRVAYRQWRRAHSARVLIGNEHADAPFVYFALHYEPEANADIYGGEYANQLDALDALVMALPEGWVVRVKENPRQMFTRRGEVFFQRFQSLSRVHWVADNTPSHELTEKAQLVASLSGTAGYEALCAGKSCIYFGQPWYAGLPGATRFVPGVDLALLAGQRVERAALDAAVNRLVSDAADGIVQRRSVALLPDTGTRPAMTRQTALSLAAISRAAQLELGDSEA